MNYGPRPIPVGIGLRTLAGPPDLRGGARKMSAVQRLPNRSAEANAGRPDQLLDLPLVRPSLPDPSTYVYQRNSLRSFE